MVAVRGIARIRHAETGEIFEIPAAELEFEASGHEERSMGPEYAYIANYDHPELGELFWAVWEYPVGAFNDRETIVGPHELIEDFDISIETGPDHDDTEDEIAQLKQAKVEELVEWFHARYEHPDNETPYEGREGGYIWVDGGPYDAREVLSDNFDEVDEEIIEAAVEKVESIGISEWAPVRSADYLPDDDAPAVGEDEWPLTPDEEASEIDALISNLPAETGDPLFKLGDDGLIHMLEPEDAGTIEGNKELLGELTEATEALITSLNGTNAHGALLEAAARYQQALPIGSITQIYSRGVSLSNAAVTTRRSIEHDALPPLPSLVEQHLNTVQDLHAAYIMTHPTGKELAEASAAYNQPANDYAELKNAIGEFSEAVAAQRELFAGEVIEQFDQLKSEIIESPQSDRTAQVATQAVGNLTRGMLWSLKTAGFFTVGVVTTSAVGASVPATELAAHGTAFIDLAWAFISAHSKTLGVILAAPGADGTWIANLPNILARIERLKR